MHKVEGGLVSNDVAHLFLHSDFCKRKNSQVQPQEMRMENLVIKCNFYVTD